MLEGSITKVRINRRMRQSVCAFVVKLNSGCRKERSGTNCLTSHLLILRCSMCQADVSTAGCLLA
jgi:hypothetical protein